jgi:hypothetical protein
MTCHVTFAAGSAVTHTIANPGPTEFAGAGVQFNRRAPIKLANRNWARVYVGGSTDANNTAEMFVEYTTDPTGAAGWTPLGTYDDPLDGATGPLVSLFRLNGVGTAWGPWVQVDPAAQVGTVLLRARGRLGDGLGYNAVTVGCAFTGGFKYEGRSLAGGTAGPGIIMFGGSQIAGGGTIGTGPGEFGTLPAPLVPVPAGCTLVRQGVTLTEHDAGEHGAEAGVLAACDDANVSANLVCRYVDATIAADWTDTHLATLATDVTNAGITPRLALYIQGGGDADTATTVGKYDYELRRLRGALQTRWPGIAFVAMPVGSQDLVEHPMLVEARVPFKRRMSEPYRGLTDWVSEVGLSLQGDNRHPTSAGEVEMGRRMVAPWIAAGKLS